MKVGSLEADIEKVGCAVLHSSHAHVVPSLLGRRRGDSSIGRTSKLVDESAHDLVEAVVEWSVGGAVGPARLRFGIQNQKTAFLPLPPPPSSSPPPFPSLHLHLSPSLLYAEPAWIQVGTMEIQAIQNSRVGGGDRGMADRTLTAVEKLRSFASLSVVQPEGSTGMCDPGCPTNCSNEDCVVLRTMRFSIPPVMMGTPPRGAVTVALRRCCDVLVKACLWGLPSIEMRPQGCCKTSNCETAAGGEEGNTICSAADEWGMVSSAHEQT